MDSRLINRTGRSNRRSAILALGVALAIASVGVGCNNAGQGAVSGAGIGALTGLIIGSMTGAPGQGAAIGAVGGAVVGGVIGDQNSRDRRYGGSNDGYYYDNGYRGDTYVEYEYRYYDYGYRYDYGHYRGHHRGHHRGRSHHNPY